MTGPSKTVRRFVLHRDNGQCVRCGKTVYNTHSEQPVQQYSLQHRRARGMGGSKDPQTNSPVNLILLCGTATTGCHGYVESHRDEARYYGWGLRQSDNPEERPVFHIELGWIELTETGFHTIWNDQGTCIF